MINLTFNGNLARDAEIKVTNSGTTLAAFTVAVSVGYGDNKKTEWVKCALFGKRAEGGLVQYLTKGAKVLITGSAASEAWVDAQGQAKGCISVNVADIELVGSAQQQQPQQQQQYQQPARSPNASPYANVQQGSQPMHNGAQDFGIEDDIPFRQVPF